jgi:hypothetical protein
MCPERTEYFLVGAAGFEPTTCSTQNCRATRLRYTPFSPWSIHACGVRSKVWPRSCVVDPAAIERLVLVRRYAGARFGVDLGRHHALRPRPKAH